MQISGNRRQLKTFALAIRCNGHNERAAAEISIGSFVLNRKKHPEALSEVYANPPNKIRTRRRGEARRIRSASDRVSEILHFYLTPALMRGLPSARKMIQYLAVVGRDNKCRFDCNTRASRVQTRFRSVAQSVEPRLI
jgi:hypothetical protein